MRRTLRALITSAACAAALTIPFAAAEAAPKKTFNIAWTIYVGWMPWAYAAENGIVKKWADKYGITIDVTQINDYVEIDQPVHRRQVRRRDADQYGRADHPRRRRRRHHRAHHRRLLERQ